MEERFKLELNFGDLRIRDMKKGEIVKVYANALRNDLWNVAIEENRLLNSIK